MEGLRLKAKHSNDRMKRNCSLIVGALFAMMMIGCQEPKAQEVKTSDQEQEYVVHYTKEDVVDYEKQANTSVVKVYVDRYGYALGDNKVAYFRGMNVHEQFDVVDISTKEIVFSGKIVILGEDPKTKEKIAYGDFSAHIVPGSYYIQTPFIGCSYTFTVQEDSLQKQISSIKEEDAFDEDGILAKVVTLKMLTKEFDGSEDIEQFDNDQIKELIEQLRDSKDQGEEAMAYRCAAFSLAHQLFLVTDTAYSNTCLEQAVKAKYDLIKLKPSDEYLYLANAYLYKCSGNKTQQNEMKKLMMKLNRTKLAHEEVVFYGDMAYLSTNFKTDDKLCNEILQYYFDEADLVLKEWDDFYSKTENSLEEVNWDQNYTNQMLLEAMKFSYIERIAHNDSYCRMIQYYLHHLNGENVMGKLLLEDNDPYHDEQFRFIAMGLNK